MTRRITVDVSETVYTLLEVLTRGEFVAARTVEGVVEQLIDHAQQGVYRPGAWERLWLMQAFGDEWLRHMEAGDPHGREDAVSRQVFQRPKRAT